MSGQMGGGSGGYGTGDGMAVWMESRERRIRMLEAENQELRRQLDALRQGAGITVLIDGQPHALAASISHVSAHAAESAIPNDTRPAATPAMPTGARAAVQRPHVSRPGDNPYMPQGSAPALPASGYAFEQPWRASASPGPLPPVPQPSPSLPSMPTTQMPIPAARPPARRPHATDSSWLTDERPAVPSSTPGNGSRAPIPTGARHEEREEDAWLRSGAAWPQPARRPTALPELPARPDTPLPSASYPARPVSAPRRTPLPTLRPTPREQAPAERNVYADSFIL